MIAINYDFWSSKKTSKLLIWVIKFTVIVLLGLLIFDRIIDYELSPDIYHFFVENIVNSNRVWAFSLCCSLMIVNWILEVYKWKLLSNSFISQSFTKAAEGVLVGIASGIVTPSRLGEYGGRIFNIPNGLKTQGIHAHFLASLSQNSINILMGTIGAYIYATYYLNWSPYLMLSLVTLSLVALLVVLLIFFNHNGIINLLYRNLPSRFKIFLHFKHTVQDNFTYSLLNNALLISLVRYFVFTTQYALLLYFFGIEISLLATISGISLIYLIQSGVPLPPFLSMLARGEIAIIVWSVFDASVLSILSATFTLWILNLLVPALIGAYILLKNPNKSE